jgi:lipopolysaccharide/colanic/teichoic acid biosynthesis glycosyltransferase
MYKSYFKRIIDFIGALIGLFLLSPIFIIAVIGLYFANQGKPFFFQMRPGKNGRLFNIIKFKTMNDKKDTKGALLTDEERLTKIGIFVRKTSLDEIPQLINVLTGDMSLIGPRPLLPEYLPHYDEVQKRRHEVRPGITGLAQVKGRNQMKFSERLKNDVYYVDHLSFLFDVKILLMTVQSVLFKTSTVIIGQTVDDVDDIGLSKNLSSNHFKKK